MNPLHESSHAVTQNAAKKVREYLDGLGIDVNIQEAISDAENGQKVCELHVFFTITGKEGKREHRAV